MFRTLPRQLFLYLVPGMLLVLAVAGWYLDKLVDDQLTAYFDTTLDAKARSIVALTEQDEDGVELEVYDVALPRFSREIDPDYFHMVDSSGETLFISPNATGFTESLPVSDDVGINGVFRALTAQNRNESNLHYFDHKLPDGRSGRWVAVSYYPRIDSDDDEAETAAAGNQTLEQTLSSAKELDTEGLVWANGVLITPERVLTFVGTSRSALDQLMWAIDIILFLTGVVIAAAIVLIAGIGIRRAIAPLDQLGTDIAALDERSLDSRITLSRPMAELDVLVDQFNQLLQRLRTAFSRERQFSADVAHELRTPIAEMRSLIEVAARFPENAELAATYSQDLLDSTERMQLVVEQLMLLSKTEHESFDIGDPVDLVALLYKLIENYQDKAAERGLSISFSTDRSSLMVCGARVWPMILINVLDNAIDHASDRGTIVCDLSVSQSSFTLYVSNPCSDLVEQDMELLSNRLWRKDSARSDGSHSGLGLALVAAYARRLKLGMQPSLASSADAISKTGRFSLTFTGVWLTDAVSQEPLVSARPDTRVSSAIGDVLG